MKALLVIAAGLLMAGAILYDLLIRARNRVDAAWGDIDVQLQRRDDLIPMLVKAVDQYADHEKATLEAVTRLRAEARRVTDIENLGDIEEELSSGLRHQISVAEHYPDLKADEYIRDLRQELAQTENYLQFVRRYYDGSVREYNTLAGTVPSNLVAGAFGFIERKFFQKGSNEVASVPLVEFGSVE